MIHVKHEHHGSQKPRWMRGASKSELREIAEMREQIAEIEREAERCKRAIQSRLRATIHRIDTRTAYREAKTEGIREISERIAAE